MVQSSMGWAGVAWNNVEWVGVAWNGWISME
jgi:hypothetical protein